jgi:alpha-L-fucosidase 2
MYDPERGIHFNTAIRVKPINGGSIKTYASGDIKLIDCKEVEIIIANATSFNGFDKDPVKQGSDYVAISHRIAANAFARDYNDVLNDHVADYKSLFDRVSLDLGSTDQQTASLTTDKQLLSYRDFDTFNPELEALYFQFGRYLLISCSRTAGVPANLQGLWNESILPPWSCNYTSNINLEENYWPSCTTNLSELQLPLLEFINNLQTTGTESAKAYCGVQNGWMLAHNTDIWAMTCPVGLKSGDPSWANWYLGGAWVATHIWEHYQFTQDRELLAKYYPALRGAADFCLDWLTEYNGELVTSPGTSPENKFIDNNGNAIACGYGTTSDLAMIRECLLDAIAAAKELGTDKAFVAQAQKTLKKLHPYKIGSKGGLQEWYNDWAESEPGHRHQSHLFGLYPGHHISVAETPELAKACAKTLELRGDKTTGWSSGWRINLQARLGDAEKSYYVFRKLLSYISPDNYRGSDALRGGGTYPNLLDAHSPFQIDGNFGGTAGVAEMLVQSTSGNIVLLPALPDKWKAQGKVSGLCARGGFTVDFEWKDGKVVAARVYSKAGGKTKITVNGKTKAITLKANQSKQIL